MCRDKISEMRYRILIVDDEKMIRMGIKNTMPWEKIENVNIKCERFFDFFQFSIMHKR